jgi:ubiquinone/menaquinone biosynthesis C-methylase UbiE
MAHHVYPWWLGYFLASPIRKLRHNPDTILSPYVREGMTILEPGPGMGFFTLELARRVGNKGRVVAIDIQQKMLNSLRRRAQRRRVSERIDFRLARSDGMGTSDLNGKVDFVLAFAVVHELPDAGHFLRESFSALKSGGKLLFSEPSNVINEAEFEKSLVLARKAGFSVAEMPTIQSSISAVLVKDAPRRNRRMKKGDG